MLFSFVIELYSIFANPEEWQYREKLRLGELPLLPIIEILGSMSLGDQIRLALSSEKYEQLCKIARVEAPWYCLHVMGEILNLDVGSMTTLCCGEECSDSEKDIITSQEIKKWFNQNNVSSPLLNLIGVFERVHAIFPTDEELEFFIYFDEDNFKLEEIFEHFLFKNCKDLALVRGEIDAKDLSYILDTAKELNFLRLLDIKVPSDFQHERAFSIECIEYEDANWVKLENLLTMRNSTYVTLGTTSLNYSDFNKFLKFWVNNEVDMFLELCITMDENINPQKLFDGLLRLDSARFTTAVYLIIADSTMVSRNNPLLYVQYINGKLKFKTYSRTCAWFFVDEDRNISTAKKTFQSEFDALRTLEKKEELRKKMEGMELPDEDDMQRMEELDIQLNELLAEEKFTVGE